MPSGWRCSAWPRSAAPFLIDLDLGNVSLIVTFLAVLAWRWLDRPLGSIALAASLTIRPTMGLICAWWLLRGMWRPVAWTVIAFGVLVVLTLPFVGLDGWFDYVTVLGNVSNVTGVPRNVDLGSAVLLFGGRSRWRPWRYSPATPWRSARCC